MISGNLLNNNTEGETKDGGALTQLCSGNTGSRNEYHQYMVCVAGL